MLAASSMGTDSTADFIDNSNKMPQCPIVIAACPDSLGQDTINFVFSKIVNFGDSITILHILEHLDDEEYMKGNGPSSPMQPSWSDAFEHATKKQLAQLLFPHRSACLKKHINVRFHVVRSTKFPDSIVEEAYKLRASFLILGSSSKSSTFMRRLSGTARYCCRNPPPNCTVMAVSNGLVVGTRTGELTLDTMPPHGSKSHSLTWRSLSENGRSHSQLASPSSSLASSTLSRLSSILPVVPESQSSTSASPPLSRSSSTSSSSSPSHSQQFEDRKAPSSSSFSLSSRRHQSLVSTKSHRRAASDADLKPPLDLRSHGGSKEWGRSRTEKGLGPLPETPWEDRNPTPAPAQVPPTPPRPRTHVTRLVIKESSLSGPRTPQGSGVRASPRHLSSIQSWDDSMVGLKPSSRPGSFQKLMGSSELSQLPALGLAAASGVARQGSGTPSARLMAGYEMSAMDLITSSRLAAKSPGSAINSGLFFSNSLKSFSGSFRMPSRGSGEAPGDDAGLLMLSALLDMCSVREGSSSGPRPSPGPKPGVLNPSPLRVSPASRQVNGELTRTVSMGTGAKFFPYEVMAKATNDFCAENLVGKGGFAEVFRGTLEDGTRVAVKRLFQKKKSEIEFLSEVGIVSHVKHPNATGLLGYSIDERHRLLVYELLPHGSLERNLHRRFRKTLDWGKRLKASIGAAKGLQYLHHECPRRIIHRDVKPANILIGNDYEAQICDFGLAKWVPEKGAFSSLGPVEGTFGYMAPEYFLHGELNVKTDVYAFGIVLLEIISGRRPIDVKNTVRNSRSQPKQSLLSWAQPHLASGNCMALLDPRLKGAVDKSSLRRMCVAALMCLRYIPDYRPTMGEVARLLEGNNVSDEILIREWPNLVDSSVSNTIGEELRRMGEKEYTESKYYRDMEQHLALALANPEGLVRST